MKKIIKIIVTLIFVFCIFLILKYLPFCSKVIKNSSEKDFITHNIEQNGENFYVYYDEIPKDIVNAFIAVEDRTFWENEGVDLKGIFRACFNIIKTKGKTLEGGSTITQQLVRNVYLTHERSIDRKIKEVIIAFGLNKKYSKEEIIEFYINDICYSNGIYGIKKASLVYFNKDLNELSLSEICYLCAIPNGPEYYNPYKDYTKAIKRRDKILGDMLELSFINKEIYEEVLKEKIIIYKKEN